MPLTKTFSAIEVEQILCVCVLAFFAMQGAIPGIAPNEANEMTHMAATNLMKVAGIGSQLLINATIAMLVLGYIERLRHFAFALQWTAAIAALSICSTVWSQDATTTARRSIPFALAAAFGLYFASRFQIREQLSILTSTMVLLALASAALAFFAPSIGLEASQGHHGDWQGVFTQKNACGRAMVFAGISLLSAGRMNPARYAALLLFTVVLVMSGSRGAWLIGAILIFCFGLLCLLDRFDPGSRVLLLYGLAFAMIAGLAAAWFCLPMVMGLLHRDVTLTGRTAIWHQVWIAIRKRPLLGYGFSAFWQGMRGESSNVTIALRFVVFHAHNGLLEMWLELGATGLLLFVLSYLRAWRKLWVILRSGGIRRTFWMILFLLFIALYNFDENTLLTFNGIFWVLYVAAVANIEIFSLEHRQLSSLNNRAVSIDPFHRPSMVRI
ncbi:O-antigen ligase [Acidobacterium sp. S8]|uniref:O-antigen ligase family protein n=1 Tax=Acidobacterium sp. S8 TaxID=1641854 RepID=UPI00131B7974|nr:O-antigen ligase [Acidobacterium sp. S8]